LIEAVLRPGDCLYLPRGFLHAATALGGVSTHLTIGVHSWTRFALAEQLLQQALRTVSADGTVRASLALGVDFADSSTYRRDAELTRSALIAALEQADVEQLAATLRRAARGTQRAAPIGPLKQLRDADTIITDTVIVLREHLAATVDRVGQRSVLRSRATDFPITEDDAAPVKALLAQGRARADDLGLELARRLVLAGLAVVE
jgi:ribosomal protein L16 Arg81 hydroxylase